MRNLKKLLAVVVAICVLATFTLPAFAADAAALSPDTQTCANLGVLVGTGSDGVTAEYAATAPTRVQSLVMVLRLTGSLAAAQAFTGTDNFADADTAAWAKPLMAYAKAHPELGFVGDGVNFMPGQLLTAQMYYKVLLTALGYATPGDYAYADTLAFAKDTVKLPMVGSVDSFTIDALATATVEGLKGAVKGGTKTLAATLVEASKLDKAAAITAGLYSDVMTATASQTGAKTITVKFNRALTAAEKTAATFDVKNGLVAYAVTPTWAADNTSVALAYEYNYYAGDYTVAVGGITDPLAVTVVDEKVTKIVINNDYMAKSLTSAIDSTVTNQFGEEMDDQTLTFSAYDATHGINYGTSATNEFDLSAPETVIGDSIVLTVTHAATGTVATKTVPVNDASSAKTLTFAAVQPLSGDSRVSVNNEGYVLPYTFTDQFGKAIKLTDYIAGADGNVGSDANTETINGIKFMTSDAGIVNPDTFAVDADGVLTFDTGASDGTVIISAIVPSTGAVGTTTIKVEADAAVKTFTISNPGKLIAAGDEVVIPYTAVDTFGKPIAMADFKAAQQGDVQINSSNNAIIDDTALTGDVKFNGKNELVVTPAADGTVTLYPTVDGVMQNSITLTVKETAVPTKITGLKDVPTLFQIGGTDTIENSNLKVIDQYNRPIDLDLAGNYTVTAAIDGAPAGNVTLVSTGAFNGATDQTTTLTGAVAGSEKLIFTLLDGATSVSTYKVTAKTISNDDIVGFSVDTIGNLYAYDTNASLSPYAVEPKLLGKDASGNAVTMDPAYSEAFTSSNTSVVNVAGNTDIFAVKAGTATIAIWHAGKKLAETTVTAKDEAPYAATAEFDNTTLALAVAGSDDIILTVKDQYGVEIPNAVVLATNGTVYTSDAAVASFVAVGDTITVTGNAVGTATISYVTNTGIVVTCEVVVG